MSTPTSTMPTQPTQPKTRPRPVGPLFTLPLIPTPTTPTHLVCPPAPRILPPGTRINFETGQFEYP